MIRRILVALLSLLVLVPLAARADDDAQALVKSVTEQVLGVLRQDKGNRAGDQRRAIALIESKVAPHFDFERMTRLAVGRAWQQADARQRQALVAEFKTLLVRTYANSLTAYRNQTVSFKPAPPAAAADEVTVRSQINQPGGQPIQIDYSLAKSAGGWKVFDVMVADVSLVTSYRGSFATEMDKGGIAGLLQALREKNRRLQETPTAAVPGGNREVRRLDSRTSNLDLV